LLCPVVHSIKPSFGFGKLTLLSRLPHRCTMKSYIVAAFAAFASTVAAADGVKGAAEGFAKGKLMHLFTMPV
jgi:hypothetical protein